MEFKYNIEKTQLLRIMRSKAEKNNIKITEKGDKIQIDLKPGSYKPEDEPVPVTFKGKISDKGEGCRVKGRFTYGFYLYTLVIVAAVLIIARFLWSYSQSQTDNMILCAIVTVLLIVVIVVVMRFSKHTKKTITDFLEKLVK